MIDGLIDIHCHLLPGIDDGCTSLKETLESVQRLRTHGFAGSVCTPHFFLDLFPDNTPEFIDARVRELREEVERAGLEYQLWPGAEVRLARGTVDWFEDVGVPTLGSSRCVLVDHWGDYWPKYADAAIQYLLDNGYQPILAHPERMALDPAEMRTVLAKLRSKGVWLQGNLNSLAGGEGTRAREVMHELLEAESYYLIATDTHHPHDLDDRMEGLRRLQSEYRTTAAQQMLDARPRQILLPATSSS